MGFCDLVFKIFTLPKSGGGGIDWQKVKSMVCIPSDDTVGNKCLVMVLGCYPLPKQAELFFSIHQ